MSRARSAGLRACIVAVPLLLQACAGSEPVRFYTLEPIAEPAPRDVTISRDDRAIGIGPILLPDYLDRPQIVGRDGSNRIVMSDLDAWAAPLSEQFARTLAVNLADLLGTQNVYDQPLRRPVAIDNQVEVDINRFDIRADNVAVLDARWRLYGRDGESLQASGVLTVTEPAAPESGFEGRVQALSRCVAELSRKIAAAIASRSA
ncbi:PqiC family protein [Marinivivus vitaminiproducens]|uniref:PqiC family protein n=1 Tax=Marinivivus vitaminiproducens TaxID=3035935 RepID=UPI00279D5525|nr:PqiC family protein [Geminicoccaceae bacterium SCSIO 64248]